MTTLRCQRCFKFGSEECCCRLTRGRSEYVASGHPACGPVGVPTDLKIVFAENGQGDGPYGNVRLKMIPDRRHSGDNCSEIDIVGGAVRDCRIMKT